MKILVDYEVRYVNYLRRSEIPPATQLVGMNTRQPLQRDQRDYFMRNRSDIRTPLIVVVCVLLGLVQNTVRARQQSADLEGKMIDLASVSAIAGPNKTGTDSLMYLQSHEAPVKWYSMITNLPGDWVQYYSQEFRTSNIPEYVGLSVLTAGLLVTDDATYKVSDRWYKNSRAVTDVSDFFVSLGDGKSQFALAGAFAAYGLVKDDHRALRTGSQIVQAVLGSGAVVQLLKHITGRESPFTRTSPTGTWRFFPNQLDYLKHVPAYDAFPSGHICTAMATVIVIAENYPETKWIRPVGYVVSGLVGVGMVNRGIHWYSDYPLGLAIGYAFGMIAAHPEGVVGGTVSSETSTHVSIAPSLNEKGVGLSFAVAF
jgi:membrane-associated phospholipid phosphatase